MSKRKGQDLSVTAPVIAPIFAKKSKLQVKEDDGSQKRWKIVCWNVAGLRACVKKSDFKEILSEDPDIILLEETKCLEWPSQVEDHFKGYKKTLVISKEKNGGYAGVGLLTKVAPLKITKGIGVEEFDTAGRIVIAEFVHFYFIGVYVPNSGSQLVALDKRERWEQLVLKKIKEWDAEKPVIYGGDLNVAHNEIDLKNPDSNRNKTPGFTDKERGWFSNLLQSGFKDTFREIHPDDQTYSFWSYMNNARSKNVGWRLDYYVVSDRILDKVKKSEIMTNVMGSDHAPIVLDIEF